MDEGRLLDDDIDLVGVIYNTYMEGEGYVTYMFITLPQNIYNT